jgi:hypothetical protein
LNRQYTQVIHPASYYMQALALSSQGHNPPAVAEDEKTTLRLSSVRPTRNHLTGHEDQPRAMRESPSQFLNEVKLANLSAGDQLLIETSRSVYCFTVTDPNVPCGKLTGGILGNRLVAASLVPAHSGSRRPKFARRSLRTNSKFIFLIEQGKYLRRLTTSAVTRLIHRKKVKTRVLSASMREVTLEHLSSDKSDV